MLMSSSCEVLDHVWRQFASTKLWVEREVARDPTLFALFIHFCAVRMMVQRVWLPRVVVGVLLRKYVVRECCCR